MGQRYLPGMHVGAGDLASVAKPGLDRDSLASNDTTNPVLEQGLTRVRRKP